MALAKDHATTLNIKIEPYGQQGFAYTAEMPGYYYGGIAGYSPTRAALAADIAELINRHMASGNWQTDELDKLRRKSASEIARHIKRDWNAGGL